MKIKSNWVLFVAAFVLFFSTLAISLLSHSFILGEGYIDRPILRFLFLEAVSFVVFFMAVEWVRKHASNSRKLVCFIFLVGVLLRFLFIPSNMLQEVDAFRYLWDGQSVIQLSNPFALSPTEAFENKAIPVETLSMDAERVYKRINFPEIRTIYPPLAQCLFGLSQWISPWQLDGWRWMIFMTEILIFILLLLILRKAQIKFEWLLLYAWCPLILKEFSNSLHLDVFLVLSFCLLIYACMQKWIVRSFVFLALGVLVKFTPVIFLPLIFIWGWKKDPKKTLIGFLSFSSVIFLFYFPFIFVGDALFEGLKAFSTYWSVNQSIFSVVHFLMDQLPWSEEVAARASRICVAGLLGAAGGVLCVRLLKAKKNETKHLIYSLFILLTTLFFIAPTGNPWYFTWVFPFLIFIPMRSLVLFSGLVFLYYLDFYFMYRDQDSMFRWVRLVEYSIFYSCFVLECYLYRNKKEQLLNLG